MGEPVALWKRVSSDQQDIRNQDDTLSAHVTANGYDVRRPAFELPDTSAFKFEQEKALAEVLEDVRAGRYTRVIAVTSSRFLRSDERIGVGYLLELDAAGGRLEAADNPLFGDLTNPGGWHVTVAALGGDYSYSKNISGNVNRGFARMDKDELRGNGYVGAAFRGMPPAGYSVQGEENARYLEPDTGQPEVRTGGQGERESRRPRKRYLAKDIRHAFKLAATGGPEGSTSALGRKLRMSPDAVGKMLRRPVYGSGRYEVISHRDCDDPAECIKAAKKKEKARGSRCLSVVHRCKPLVTVEVQRAAIAGLQARRTGDNWTSRQLRRAMVAADPSKADFSGALWCGVCEMTRPTMHRIPGGQKKRKDGTKPPKTRRYWCNKRMGGCGRSVNADAADAEVNRLMSGSDRLWARLVHIPGDDNSAEITRVRDELDSLGARRLPRAEMLAETTRLYDELDRLESMPRTPARNELLMGDETIGQRWESLDMAGRREWLLTDFRVRVAATGNRDGSVTAEVGYPPGPVKFDVRGHDLGGTLRGTVERGVAVFWKGEDK